MQMLLHNSVNFHHFDKHWQLSGDKFMTPKSVILKSASEGSATRGTHHLHVLSANCRVLVCVAWLKNSGFVVKNIKALSRSTYVNQLQIVMHFIEKQSAQGEGGQR